MFFCKKCIIVFVNDARYTVDGIPFEQRITAGKGRLLTGTAAEESVVMTGEDSQSL
jgi:hypothetical protein